jgi:hypothetical protein
MRLSRLFACAILSWLACLAPQRVFAEPPRPDAAVDPSRGTTPSAAFGSTHDPLTDTGLDLDADHDADLDVPVAIGPDHEHAPVERHGVAAGTGQSIRSSAAPRAPPSSRR